MKTGSLRVLGDLDTGDKTWVRIYENTLAAPATTLTISGLTGDTDIEYKLSIRPVGGAAVSMGVEPNSDDTSGNYGFQFVKASNATVSATRLTSYAHGMYFGYVGSSHVSQHDFFIHAKSGYVRSSITSDIEDVDGTTVDSILLVGSVWNSTAAITALKLKSSDTDGFGTGTSIELYTLR